MTTALVQTYTPRFAAPDLIEREKATRLAMEIQYEGAKVVPVSGLVTLRRADNSYVLNAVAATVSDGVAVYDLSAIAATYAVSRRWLQEWELTFADGQVHTFRRGTHLCLRRLYPCVTVGHMTRRHWDLARLVAKSNGNAVLQGYLDDAWDTVLLRLISDGVYPQQVMSGEDTIEAHKALALGRAFTDIMLGPMGEEKYGSLAKFYLDAYEAAWTSMRLTIDRDEDNRPPSAAEQGQAEQGMIQLGGAPRSWGTQ